MVPCPGSAPARSHEMHHLGSNKDRIQARRCAYIGCIVSIYLCDSATCEGKNTFYEGLDLFILTSTTCVSAQVYTEELGFIVQAEIII